jgi:hypothetical protein
MTDTKQIQFTLRYTRCVWNSFAAYFFFFEGCVFSLSHFICLFRAFQFMRAQFPFLPPRPPCVDFFGVHEHKRHRCAHMAWRVHRVVALYRKSQHCVDNCSVPCSPPRSPTPFPLVVVVSIFKLKLTSDVNKNPPFFDFASFLFFFLQSFLCLSFQSLVECIRTFIASKGPRRTDQEKKKKQRRQLRTERR